MYRCNLSLSFKQKPQAPQQPKEDPKPAAPQQPKEDSKPAALQQPIVISHTGRGEGKKQSGTCAAKRGKSSPAYIRRGSGVIPRRERAHAPKRHAHGMPRATRGCRRERGPARAKHDRSGGSPGIIAAVARHHTGAEPSIGGARRAHAHAIKRGCPQCRKRPARVCTRPANGDLQRRWPAAGAKGLPLARMWVGSCVVSAQDLAMS